MTDRVGQVWWARPHDIREDFEPHVVMKKVTLYHLNDGWILHRLDDITSVVKTITVYETQFDHVEKGGDNAWVKSRLD